MKYSRTRPGEETRTTQINIRLTPVELDELAAVCRELRLDMSNALRFLVREKARELGVVVASRAPAEPATPRAASGS